MNLKSVPAFALMLLGMFFQSTFVLGDDSADSPAPSVTPTSVSPTAAPTVSPTAAPTTAAPTVQDTWVLDAVINTIIGTLCGVEIIDDIFCSPILLPIVDSYCDLEDEFDPTCAALLSILR